MYLITVTFRVDNIITNDIRGLTDAQQLAGGQGSGAIVINGRCE